MKDIGDEGHMTCAEDFQALSKTISSIYELHRLGVTAIYVCRELWEWMQYHECKSPTLRLPIDKSYEESGAEFHSTKNGTMVATMKPLGADSKIPVKVKFSGNTPWKVVVAYRN